MKLLFHTLKKKNCHAFSVKFSLLFIHFIHSTSLVLQQIVPSTSTFVFAPSLSLAAPVGGRFPRRAYKRPSVSQIAGDADACPGRSGFSRWLSTPACPLCCGSNLCSSPCRVDKDRSGVISDSELQQALSNGVYLSFFTSLFPHSSLFFLFPTPSPLISLLHAVAFRPFFWLKQLPSRKWVAVLFLSQRVQVKWIKFYFRPASKR